MGRVTHKPRFKVADLGSPGLLPRLGNRSSGSQRHQGFQGWPLYFDNAVWGLAPGC